MRIIAEYDSAAYPPLLKFYIHGAPHRRMHRAIIESYRKALLQACAEIRIKTPIKSPIDLSVVFIDPTSPDLDNLLTATFRALDGKTRSGVLADDGLIHSVKMMKLIND